MLTVLVADDEAIERRYLCSIFQKQSNCYQVIAEAKNGQEVLQLTGIHKPDVIIMDINMPLLNGLESAALIKARSPETIILLNTAYAEFEFARKAVDYNLDAYLLKPAREKEIFDTIENCLKRRRKESAPSKHTAALSKQQFNSVEEAMAEVIGHIDEHFYAPLPLQELADIVHFSPAYLSRIFHKKQGVTIKTYITRKRLENAKYLLRETSMSIHEIGINCGFLNVSHFNRIFKQQMECSPMEYRRQVK